MKWSSHHIFSIEITRYLYLWPHIKYANRGLANILTFVFFVFFSISRLANTQFSCFFPYNLLCCGFILYPRNLRKPSHKFSSEAILGVFRTLQTRPLSFLHLAVIYEWFTSAMIIMTFMSSKNFKILRNLIIHHISCDWFVSTLGTIRSNDLWRIVVERKLDKWGAPVKQQETKVLATLKHKFYQKLFLILFFSPSMFWITIASSFTKVHLLSLWSH